MFFDRKKRSKGASLSSISFDMDIALSGTYRWGGGEGAKSPSPLLKAENAYRKGKDRYFLSSNISFSRAPLWDSSPFAGTRAPSLELVPPPSQKSSGYLPDSIQGDRQLLTRRIFFLRSFFLLFPSIDS